MFHYALMTNTLDLSPVNPQLEKSTSVSVSIHQPSEEEPLHQQALWDCEYLMLHLVKTQLHFCSDLP